MSGRWDAESGSWRGWEGLGPEPEAWSGPVGTLPPEPGLHAYQGRNIPLVRVGGSRIAGGPRPPYFGWHPARTRTGQPTMRAGQDGNPGHGIHLYQRHEFSIQAAGAEGEVQAFYTATPMLRLFDGREGRRYPAPEAGALGWARGGEARGRDLLALWEAALGPGEGLTVHLRSLGFNGVVTGDLASGRAVWCVSDPRCFKRFVSASGWSSEEVARREAFDPTPMVPAGGWLGEGLSFED